MSLEALDVSHDALLCIMCHALSTEQQEVMGLLLGSWLYQDDVARSAVAAEAKPLTRSDRRPNRVEVSSEQLAAAVAEADERGLQVIGWYHSHPHITAAPSHVDARTQGQYQSLHEGFAGLICAVFQQRDDAIFPSIKIVAFQSYDAANQPGGFAGAAPHNDRIWRPRELAVHVTRRRGGCAKALRALAALQDALFQEEVDARAKVETLFADAVFRKGIANIANDSLHPLIYVVKAKLADLTARRDRFKAELAAISSARLAEVQADSSTDQTSPRATDDEPPNYVDLCP